MKRFYQVYMEGHLSSAEYFQNFDNAYRAWINMITPNEVVEEILMSGITTAREKEKDNGIFLDYGDCYLESIPFCDGED